ncbi:MAG: ABC-F type ribosomal protection protein [Lactobacillales bacterium]|nr:ABC-F type ribosomal protection protein [Lactobacillales bacterium]
MSKIEFRNLTFAYDGQVAPIFDRANLIIDSDWKLGLIGRNGRGKTTLLRILQGQVEFSGEIIGAQDFVYFPQAVRDPQQLTSYALQELAEYEEWKLERELTLLGVDLDVLWRPFATLSGGEKTKVLLSLLFVDENNFPLIDEPTNHLDVKGREQVAEYLRRKKQGFIVVSHDRHFVDEVVDHVVSINKAQIQLYQGNFSTFDEQKKLQDSFELEQDVKLRGEISRLKKTASDKHDWSLGREGDNYGNPNIKGSGGTGHDGFTAARAARMMKKSKVLERRMNNEIEEKEKLLKDLEFVDPLKINFQPSHHHNLINCENVELSYDGTPLFQPLTFKVNKGERVVIKGANGTGKSSLIKYLINEFDGDSKGEIFIPKGIKISYVRQEYEDNRGTLREFAELKKLDYEQFLSNLKKLGMERAVFNTPIEQMSMGQQKKVELAKSLAEPAELYIWDEPLNYLDVINHEQIEELINKFEPSMLIIEHDLAFIENIGAEVIELKRN